MPKKMNEDFSTSQVAVTTTATKIVSAQQGIDEVTIENLGTTQVFIGKADVTTANGFPIPGIAGASLTLRATTDIWAIVASGSANVAVLETFEVAGK